MKSLKKIFCRHSWVHGSTESPIHGNILLSIMDIIEYKKCKKCNKKVNLN